MSDKRYPLGRTLTQFSDQLLDEEWYRPLSPGKWKDVTEDFKNVLSGGNAAFIEENREYLEKMRTLVVNNFDFAITALSLFRDFMYLIPNFMAAVASYIASYIYNVLDAFLRLGLYALVIPPNLKDWGPQGLPTTSLQEQTEIAYKKFYDVSDKNIPYYLPYTKTAAEDLIESGDKILNQYERYFLNSENTEVGASISQRLGGGKSYIKSDYIDFKQSLENLSSPLGLYEALFLYFSVDFSTNRTQINNLLETIAGLSNFFQFEDLWGVHDEITGLFAPVTKRVKILSNVKIPDIQKSFISASTTSYDKKDLYSIKRNPIDNELKDIYIFPADPIANMPSERKERLLENLKNQGYNDEGDMAILNQNAEEQAGEVFDELLAFNLKQNTAEEVDTLELAIELGNQTVYADYVDDIKEVKSEIIYYSAANFAANLENSVDFNDIEQFQKFVFNDFGRISDLVKRYGPDSTIYETSKFGNLQNFISKVNEYNSIYQRLRPQLTQTDENGNLTSGEPARDLTIFNLIQTAQQDLLNASSIIRNEYLNISDMFSITPPDLAETERIERLNELEKDKDILYDLVKKKTVDQLKARAALINENLQEKRDQIDTLSIASTTVENITNSANVVFYHNSYPLAGQNSLYKNYIQKFYNFTAVEAQNYVYEFTVKIEEKPGANNFTTNFDYIQPSQYVQVAKYNGTDYDIIADGIVMEEEMQPFNTAGGGSWAKMNFSDMIGITSTIKSLQNNVRSLERTFTPNTEALDTIIQFLKNLKERIIELIDVIDVLLELLNFSINFEGSIWAKYCKETGLEGYDKLAADLTSTEGYSKKPTKPFRPSKLSTVQVHLNKIRELDPAAADAIVDEIDNLFAQTSNHDDKDTKIQESSQISVLPDRQSDYDLAKNLGASIQNQIDQLTNIPSNLFDVGSALYTNLSNIGIASKEKTEATSKSNKILYRKAKIYAEIAKIKNTLSSEFGFSMVFLSYLPKGLPFDAYPVRYIAARLELLDKDDNPVTSTAAPPPIDENKINELLPNNSLLDLENILDQTSKDSNPSSGIKANPEPIAVTFTPFRTTRSFTLNDTTILSLSNNSNYFTGGPTGGDYEFTIKGKLENKYIHGIFTEDVLELPNYSSSIVNDFVYRYEFELEASFNNGNYTILPEINKVDVYMGVLFEGRRNNRKIATQLNGNINEIFKFGRRKKKKFIGEIEIGKEETSIIQPYILIGYENGNLQMESLTFTVTNSEIYFYRVR